MRHKIYAPEHLLWSPRKCYNGVFLNGELSMCLTTISLMGLALLLTLCYGWLVWLQSFVV